MNVALALSPAVCLATPMTQAPSTAKRRVHDPAAIRVEDGYRVIPTDRGVIRLQVRPLRWTADGWPVAGEPLGR